MAMYWIISFIVCVVLVTGLFSGVNGWQLPSFMSRSPRVSSNNRSFNEIPQKNVLWQGISMSKMNQAVAKIVTASILATTTCQTPFAVLNDMNVAYARDFQAMASKLFDEAEKMIESTQVSYKLLEKEWKDSKDALVDINKDIVFTKENLAIVENDLIKLEVKALEAFEADKSGITGLRNEVASLRASTAQKYQAAEDAALTEKPSAVAKLFQTAQNEAMILAENEKILKSFEDVEESMSAALRKSGDAVRGLQSSIKELADAEKEQLAGFDLLKDGIATSSKKFEGQREFRAGIDKILKAQGKDVKVLRGLSKDIRNVQVESDELSKISAKVVAVYADAVAFETNTKLSLKTAKTYTKNLADKTELAAKTSKASLDKILEISNAVSSRQFRKDSKISKREEVAKLLHAVSNRLEAAESSGKKADGLIREARKQGEKEASVYLKYFQYSKDGTPKSK